MKYSLVILLMLFFDTIFCQENKWNKFIPPGYTIFDTASGDLNMDGYKDMIIILKSINEPEEYLAGGDSGDKKADTNTIRPLIILHGQKDNSYKLAVRNDKIVLGVGYGIPTPMAGITITRNYFSIDIIGHRWGRKITFKYDLKKKLYLLHKDVGDSYTPKGETEQQFFNEEQWDKQKLKEYIVE